MKRDRKKNRQTYRESERVRRERKGLGSGMWWEQAMVKVVNSAMQRRWAGD
jgi:hypothetical protein